MKEKKPEELLFVFQVMTNRNLIVLHPLDKKRIKRISVNIYLEKCQKSG